MSPMVRSWTHTPKKANAFAYEHALVHPPDGKRHPLWIVAKEEFFPNSTRPPSRHATTTALRLAVSHAFTADYSQRFRPDIPETENRCKCNFDNWSWTCLLYACPRFTQVRVHTVDTDRLSGFSV